MHYERVMATRGSMAIILFVGGNSFSSLQALDVLKRPQAPKRIPPGLFIIYYLSFSSLLILLYNHSGLEHFRVYTEVSGPVVNYSWFFKGYVHTTLNKPPFCKHLSNLRQHTFCGKCNNNKLVFILSLLQEHVFVSRYLNFSASFFDWEIFDQTPRMRMSHFRAYAHAHRKSLARAQWRPKLFRVMQTGPTYSYVSHKYW